MIISASRRTDIPAFYGKWFQNRLEEGFVLVRNPFNSHQISRVALNREAVDAFVFWTKDPQPFFPVLDYLDEHGFPYVFQYTLNHYPPAIEPAVPPIEQRIATLQSLCRRMGPQRVTWRYDPIILTSSIGISQHLDNFSMLASRLAGYITECKFKFVVPYGRTKRHMKSQSLLIPGAETRHELLRQMAAIAKMHGMTLSGCCEDDYSDLDIQSTACISKAKIENIAGADRIITGRKDPGQRAACTCIQSVDIGEYDTCAHGCLYCYANDRDRDLVANLACFAESSPILGQPVRESDRITAHKVPKPRR